MSEPTWEDPPPKETIQNPSQKSLILSAFADELREHPGKWALYPLPLATKISAGSTAGRVRRGEWNPGPGFDATSRDVRVFVRFIGNDS